MSQLTSPFTEIKYGWDLGESGWNGGMDENLVKISFLFDGNIDGIVATLPSVVNGAAYFLTTDNRFYFGINGAWISSPCPKNFIFKSKTTSQFYQYNGTSVISIASPTDLESQIDSLEVQVNNIAATTVQNLNEARNLDVSQKSYVRVLFHTTSGDGGGGVYYKDTSDTVSVDNNGTVIVTNTGVRLKLVHSGIVSIANFGFVSDWNGTTGTDNTAKLAAMLSDNNISKIVGKSGSFWFAPFPGNTAKFTVTRPVTIDWNSAQLFTAETNPNSANSSSAFIKVSNIGNFKMLNYQFTDISYDNLNNSRGIQTVQIINDGTNVTYDYELGNFTVHKGQSLLTVGSTNPGVAIAKKIRFTGNCRGVDVYYGVNLAYSGDDFVGEYSVDQFNRMIFVYDVSDVNATIKAGNGNASSANLLLNAKGSRKTRNIYVKATLEQLNGRIDIVGQESDPAIEYENINIDVFIRTIGSNITLTNPPVNVGVFDSLSAFKASHTYSVNGLNVKLRTPLRFAETFRIRTISPLNKRVDLDMPRVFPVGNGNENIWMAMPGNRYMLTQTGDLSTTPVKLDIAGLFNAIGTTRILAKLSIISYVSNQTNSIMEEYLIAAATASDGTYSLSKATRSITSQVGTYNPVITVTAPSPFDSIRIGASSGGNAGAVTTVTMEFLDGI